jgi:hypothetical protein
MPVTYEVIGTNTFSSASAGITFSSIPQTYSDLRLVFTGRSNGYAAVRFNENSSGYCHVGIYGGVGNNGVSRSYGYAGLTTFGLGTGEPVLSTFDIMGYTTARHKVCITKTSADFNSAQAITFRGITAWRNTAAINSITFYANTYGFNAGSNFTLYGIASA